MIYFYKFFRKSECVSKCSRPGYNDTNFMCQVYPWRALRPPCFLLIGYVDAIMLSLKIPRGIPSGEEEKTLIQRARCSHDALGDKG